MAAVLVLAGGLGACSQVASPNTGTRLAWRSIDVGSVGLGGDFEELAGDDDLRVLGAGSDIWGTSDSFHFVYVSLSGGMDIRARVDTVDYTHEWAKAGLMVRGATATDAAHAYVGFTPTGTVEFLHRDRPGETTAAVVRDDAQLPGWIRLTRDANTLIGYVSQDGARWSEVGRTTISFDGDVLVGIAVTSRDPDRLAAAKVSRIRLETTTGATPPPWSGTGDGWACGSEPLTPAFSPTLFVSTTGSDDNDGRSADRPFRTVQQAARVAQAGDVVWVRGGVYSSNVAFEHSGTRDAPIVFESYPGECAIFDGSGQAPLERLQFWNLQYVVFRNFVVRNSPGEGIFLSNTSNSVFSHLRLHHNYLSGILTMYGNDNLFTYFVTHDNYNAPYGGDADGISVSSGNGNTVSHCVAYDNSDDGVDTWLSTNTLVEHCASFHNGFQGGDGNGFKAGGDNRTVNTVVRYSVAFGNRVNGFDWNTGRGVTFDHNTAFSNGRYGIVARQGTVRNNISVNNGDTPFSGDAWENTLVSNSWQLGITDARFVSTSWFDEGFLSLQAGSPAVAAGTPIGYAYTGAAPDLGALPLGETIASFTGIVLADAVAGPE